MCGESCTHGVEPGKSWRLYQRLTYGYPAQSPRAWTITGETAAETAILYGQTLTTLNTILAIAQDHIKIQADQLWLEADYTGSAKQQRVVSLKLLLCPLLALVTVVCFVWHARHDPQLLPPKHPKYNTPETEQGGNL